MEVRKDLYVKVLTQVRDNGPCTMKEITDALSLNTPESNLLFGAKSKLFYGLAKRQNEDSEYPMSLSAAAAFHLLEHEELQEARAQAKAATEQATKAHKQGTLAIWIAIILGGISALVGLGQLIVAIIQLRQ